MDIEARRVEFVRTEAAVRGVREMQKTFDPQPQEVKVHPAFGALKGTFTIDPSWDSTKPAFDHEDMTEWETSLERKAKLIEEGKRKLKSSLAPSRWFEHLMNAPGMSLSGMPPAVLLESYGLPNFPTNDPADRIIAATAQEYGFTVVTRDKPLLDYGKQGYLKILEC